MMVIGNDDLSCVPGPVFLKKTNKARIAGTQVLKAGQTAHALLGSAHRFSMEYRMGLPTPDLAKLVEEERFTLHDVEALRLVLAGGSVIDWRRLNFRSDDEIKAFLLTNEFHPGDPYDRERLLHLYQRACQHLETVLAIRVPKELVNLKDIFTPFRYASRWAKRSSLQAMSCMLLKIMHIANYVDGKELFNRLPIPHATYSKGVSRKIIAELTDMTNAGFPLSGFSGGFKGRESLVTKLLLRSENLAVPVFDRVRFRLICERKDHILPLLHFLLRNLVPFNYVVPGESSNRLLSLFEILKEHPKLSAQLPMLQHLPGADSKPNKFSARDYRGINFIFDVPLRVDRLCPEQAGELAPALGRIAFVLVEFQVLDAESHAANERGESSHDRYKERQVRGVLARLGAQEANSRSSAE